MKPLDILERQPPSNLEAEAAVLGSVVLTPDAYDEVSCVLSADDFYDSANRILYRHFAEMLEAGETLDVALLMERLRSAGDYERVGGSAYLARIMQAVPNAAHATYYAQIVRDKARSRSLLDFAAEVLREVYADGPGAENALRNAESRLASLADQIPVATIADGRDLANLALDDLERRKTGKHEFMPTGIVDLDLAIGGGFEPGELVVLGARTSLGKTALAVNVLAHCVIQRHDPALLFSIEMTRLEVVQRLITSQGRLHSVDVAIGSLDAAAEATYRDVARRIHNAPIFVDDSPTHTIGTLASAARRMRRKHGIKLLLVDYLQLIEPASRQQSRERDVAAISRRLKSLAQELRTPILCLVQLNRECANGERPRLHHVRESDAIAHEANKVLLLHRPNSDQELQRGQGEEIEMIIEKNRSGPRATVKLLWFRDSMRFESPAAKRHETFDRWNQ